MTTTAATSVDIETYRLLTMLSGLTTEVGTGLQMSRVGSAYGWLKREGYTTKGTKAGALVEIAVNIVEQNSPLKDGAIHERMKAVIQQKDLKMTAKQRKALGL